jgi:transposase
MVKRIRKKYSQEFKHRAVSLVMDQGYSKAEAGWSLGIHPDLIRRCQRKFKGDGSQAFQAKAN